MAPRGLNGVMSFLELGIIVTLMHNREAPASVIIVKRSQYKQRTFFGDACIISIFEYIHYTIPGRKSFYNDSTQELIRDILFCRVILYCRI